MRGAGDKHGIIPRPAWGEEECMGAGFRDGGPIGLMGCLIELLESPLIGDKTGILGTTVSQIFTSLVGFLSSASSPSQPIGRFLFCAMISGGLGIVVRESGPKGLDMEGMWPCDMGGGVSMGPTSGGAGVYSDRELIGSHFTTGGGTVIGGGLATFTALKS